MLYQGNIILFKTNLHQQILAQTDIYFNNSNFKLNQLFINRSNIFFHNIDMLQVELLQHLLHFAHFQSSIVNI